MLVMKFGGSSIADAAGIRRVCRLVRDRAGRDPLVVVSAHGGVTNELLRQARLALQGAQDLAPLVERHAAIAGELGVEAPEQAERFHELSDLLRGISFVGELTPRLLDLVASFGERLSAPTVARALAREGLPAEAVMAYDAGLVTDSRFTRARPLPEAAAAIRHWFQGHPGVKVVTGFLAKDRQGNITTLGRNGSDYSAALFAQALGAEEIQIWTDVPGVMSADPRLVPGARPLARITYDEAAELAYYGAQVLHPSTLVPAVEAEIPVRVLDTRDPDGSNTLILPQVPREDHLVRAIVHKRNIHLLNIATPRMLGHHGFMARVFDACNRHEVALDMIATTEVSVSATVNEGDHLPALIQDLESFAEVEVVTDVATLALVGHGIGAVPATVNRLFTLMSDEAIPIRMISMGARGTNVGLVIAEADTERAVQALHRGFFEQDAAGAAGGP